MHNAILEHMTSIAFQLSIILFAARVGAGVLRRLRLPGILGEIIAGAIIGPYALGGMALPGFPQGLFPLPALFPVSPELYSFATVASIILLFIVGLETDLDMFFRFSLAGTLVGISGVIISFFFGALTAIIGFAVFRGTELSWSHPTVLFMGIIATATSVGISARILSDKRRMDSAEGTTVLAAAVIDDVLGIIILAIVMGITRGSQVSVGHIVSVVVKTVGIWLGFTAAGVIFAQPISRFLKRFGDQTAVAVISLAAALFLAGIFEKAGLAMIIGAYVMGLSLSKTDVSLLIQDKLSSVQRFFVPIFFCVMGMMVDVREMINPAIFFIGVFFVLTSSLSKLLGGMMPSFLLNFTWHGALVVGIGMIPRGEVALIIAGIGLAGGFIGHDVFSISVMMAFFTTLLTPPLLSSLLDKKKPVLRRAAASNKHYREARYAMPNAETTELLVVKIKQAFAAEDFFVHYAVEPDTFYEMRKNKSFIRMYLEPAALRFVCAEEDMSFVHTVFYEVLSEFERYITQLQNIAERGTIGRNIFSGDGKGRREKNKIAKVVSPLAVCVGLRGDTKEQVFSEMVEIFVCSGQIEQSRREEVLADLLEREKNGSTGMQDGIALPHAKTDTVDTLKAVIAVKKTGVDFNALDGKPSNIFVMTLSPKSYPQPYLEFIADISGFLMNADNRRRLLAAEHDSELYDIIRQA